jgi:hypothetical protein
MVALSPGPLPVVQGVLFSLWRPVVDLARVVAAIALLLTGTGIVVATFALPFAGIAGMVALCWWALG